MKNPRLSQRYAKSIFDLAIERNEVGAVQRDMQLVHTTCTQNQDLRTLINSPIIQGYKKAKVFHYLFEGTMSPITKSFFDLIFSKGREMFVDDIAAEFVVLYNNFTNVAKASLITAASVDEVFTTKIMNFLAKEMVGKKIELDHKIDATLIGGFILNYDNKQIDKSIAREIRMVEQNFSKNLYIKDF